MVDRWILLCTAPSSPPTPNPLSDDDRLFARNITLTWNPIPESDRNGKILSYEVFVVNLDLVPGRKKRQTLNSAEACFEAAGAPMLGSYFVEGDQTNLTLEGLSKSLVFCVQH